MKLKLIVLLLIPLALLLVRCDDTTPAMDEPDPQPDPLEAFIGDFSATGQHIFGIVTYYDSTGNIIYMGTDTATVADTLISITRITDTDSVWINGLVHNFAGDSREQVKAFVRNDSLIIDHDFSSTWFNDYTRGELWLENDSLHMDYRWLRHDTWTQQALPQYGDIRSRGAKK